MVGAIVFMVIMDRPVAVRADVQYLGFVSALPSGCNVGTATILSTGPTLYACTAADTWTAVGWASQAGGVPTGSIIFIAAGTCPSGYAEVAGLNGKMWRGTVAANGNVGTTGGADSVTPTFTGDGVTSSAVSAGTPAGSNSAPTLTMNSYTPAGTNGTGTVTPTGTIAWPVGVPAFTGSAGTVPAQTFTGSSATSSAVSGGTPAGTNGASATSGNCAATNIAAGTGSTTACKATAPNLTVTAQTFTGSALGTHTHTVTATGTNGTAAFTPAGTVAWPAGVPTLAGSSSTTSAQTFTGSAATLTGSVAAPAFTGSAMATHTHTTTATGSISAVDTRAAYILLIGCQKS